jgi:hypothetical protein
MPLSVPHGKLASHAFLTMAAQQGKAGPQCHRQRRDGLFRRLAVDVFQQFLPE